MIANIYIEGIIGSEKDEDGKVTVRGVELQDVISQVERNKGAEQYNIYITSKGGLVEVGKRIARYIASLPNAHTIAEGECASIATQIHLCVPSERRKIVAGTSYTIHQPMISLQRGVYLNADQLDELSEDIASTEKEMLNMYATATGLDKVALSELMKQETSLTAEQCKQYGFASEILPAPAFKAVALIQHKSKQTNEMSELKTEITGIKSLLKSIGEKIASLGEAAPAKKQLALTTTKIALDLTTVDGFEIIVDTEDTVPKVGDKVMDKDGNSLDPGKYSFVQGVLVVVDGVIQEILPPMEMVDSAELTAQFADLKAKYDALVAERETEKAELTTLKEDVEAMAKLTSTYKPKTVVVAFKKPLEEKVKTGEGSADAVKQRLAERKANKK